LLSALRLGARIGLAVALVTGCDVSPSDFETDRPRPFDAGPDAGPAPIDCDADPSSCDVGFTCRGGECVPRTDCTVELPCAPGDECRRPDPTETSTGTCGVPADHCESSDDCGGRRPVCTGVDRCGADVDGVGASLAGELSFEVRCRDAIDCGGGVCLDGLCAPCAVDAECGARRCDEGRCVKLDACDGDAACDPFESCIERRCVADVDCTELASDTPILPGTYTDLVVCDVPHRFEASRPQSEAVRFVITSSTAVDLQVDVRVDDEPVEARRLDLPGLVAFDIPYGTETGSRTIDLEVVGRNGPAPYSLRMEPLTPPCAEDPLSLLGGEPPIRTTDRRFALRMCPARRSDRPGPGEEPDREARWQRGRLRRLSLPADEGETVQFLGEYDAGATFPWTPPPGVEWSDARELCFVDKLPVGSTVDRSNCLSARVIDDRGDVVDGAVEVDDFGRFAGAIDVGAGGAPRLEIRASNSVVSSGVDLDVFLGSTTAERESACSGADTIPPGPTELTVGSTDLGGVVCEVGWPEDAFDVVRRLDLGGVPSRVRVEIEPVSGPPAEISAGLLTQCTSAVAAPCIRGFLPGRPIVLDTFSDGEPLTLMVGADRPDVGLRVSVTQTPESVPANDRCIDALLVPPDGSDDAPIHREEVYTGAATNTSSITGEASCAPAGFGRGPDRYYTVSFSSRAEVSLRGPPGGLLWSTLDCADAEAGCRDAVATTLRQPKVSTILGADTPFVLVDGVEPDDFGAFELSVAADPECTRATELGDCLADEQCDGNVCVEVDGRVENRCPGSPLALIDGRAAVTGSTGAATNDFESACASAGPDVVYAVEVPSGTERFVARIPRADFDASILVRRRLCPSAAEQWCNDDVDPVFDPRPEVAIDAPAAGTYFIVVDAAAGEGEFRLEVDAAPASPD